MLVPDLKEFIVSSIMFWIPPLCLVYVQKRFFLN